MTSIESSYDGSERDPQRIERERDLFHALLTLGQDHQLEPFLERALDLATAATGSQLGYIEIRDPKDPERYWSVGSDSDELDVEELRERLSGGIIAETLLSGKTVQTSSAITDDRFSERRSVRVRGIEAVVCAPIGGNVAAGIVYLQGGSRGGAFSDADRELAELFAVHLEPLVDRLLVRQRLNEANDETTTLRARYELEGVVGRSRLLADALEQAMLAAPLDVNVMLRGESGTGKTQLAKVIHRNSRRASGPFVELNCAALPDTLIESELFGVVAGGHSEAKSDRGGLVAAAEGGTLFLDEIGEMPAAAQSKLLQLLHSREYYRIGSNRPSTADVRIIAATNADLDRAMQDGAFRKDLFYRLDVLSVELARLEDRKDDIEPIAESLLHQIRQQHGLGPIRLTHAAKVCLRTSEWPGNVRQLQNVLEAAAIRASGSAASQIEIGHLFPERASELGEGRTPGEPTFQEATRSFQREFVAHALRDSNWNVREVAQRLDLARSHVYNLIKAFDLSRD